MLVNLNEVLIPAKKKSLCSRTFQCGKSGTCKRNYKCGRKYGFACNHGHCGSTVSIRTAGGGVILPDSYGEEGKCAGCYPSGSRPS